MTGNDVDSVDGRTRNDGVNRAGEGTVPPTELAAGPARDKAVTERLEPTVSRVGGRVDDPSGGKGQGGAVVKIGRPAQSLDRLLSEAEVIDLLGLQNRKNPRSALKWLMRTRRLAYYCLAKGINGFSREDVARFLAGRRVAAKGESVGPAASGGRRRQ